jgi:hypothetical protein
LYKDVFAEEIREFHCDDCPYLGANANAYPSNGPANDPVVPAPCALGLTGAFLIDPEGSLFFQCGAEWMDEGGRVVYSSGDSALAHLGYGGLALTRGTIGWYEVSGVVDLGTGETAPVVGLPDGNVYARRAVSPDRFLVFFVPEDASSLDVSQLWEIAPDGSATHRGDYPPFPTEVGPAPGAMLLPDGVLFQMANGPRIVHDAIVRREIGGVSEVVYTEANDPHVKIHISGLLTGP